MRKGRVVFDLHLELLVDVERVVGDDFINSLLNFVFFRCTIINVEMHFTFTIRVGDELSRLMEHLLVLLDELRQKLTEIILREAYNQECSNDNINGDTIRAVERPVEFLHAIIIKSFRASLPGT